MNIELPEALSSAVFINLVFFRRPLSVYLSLAALCLLRSLCPPRSSLWTRPDRLLQLWQPAAQTQSVPWQTVRTNTCAHAHTDTQPHQTVRRTNKQNINIFTHTETENLP